MRPTPVGLPDGKKQRLLDRCPTRFCLQSGGECVGEHGSQHLRRSLTSSALLRQLSMVCKVALC